MFNVDCCDKQGILWRMGLLKCALMSNGAFNLLLSYPSPYLLSSYQVALHLQLHSHIHFERVCLRSCMFV